MQKSITTTTTRVEDALEGTSQPRTEEGNKPELQSVETQSPYLALVCSNVESHKTVAERLDSYNGLPIENILLEVGNCLATEQFLEEPSVSLLTEAIIALACRNAECGDCWPDNPFGTVTISMLPYPDEVEMRQLGMAIAFGNKIDEYARAVRLNCTPEVNPEAQAVLDLAVLMLRKVAKNTETCRFYQNRPDRLVYPSASVQFIRYMMAGIADVTDWESQVPWLVWSLTLHSCAMDVEDHYNVRIISNYRLDPRAAPELQNWSKPLAPILLVKRACALYERCLDRFHASGMEISHQLDLAGFYDVSYPVLTFRGDSLRWFLVFVLGTGNLVITRVNDEFHVDRELTPLDADPETLILPGSTFADDYEEIRYEYCWSDPKPHGHQCHCGACDYQMFSSWRFEDCPSARLRDVQGVKRGRIFNRYYAEPPSRRAKFVNQMRSHIGNACDWVKNRYAQEYAPMGRTQQGSQYVYWSRSTDLGSAMTILLGVILMIPFPFFGVPLVIVGLIAAKFTFLYRFALSCIWMIIKGRFLGPFVVMAGLISITIGWVVARAGKRAVSPDFHTQGSKKDKKKKDNGSIQTHIRWTVEPLLKTLGMAGSSARAVNALVDSIGSMRKVTTWISSAYESYINPDARLCETIGAMFVYGSRHRGILVWEKDMSKLEIPGYAVYTMKHGSTGAGKEQFYKMKPNSVHGAATFHYCLMEVGTVYTGILPDKYYDLMQKDLGRGSVAWSGWDVFAVKNGSICSMSVITDNRTLADQVAQAIHSNDLATGTKVDKEWKKKLFRLAKTGKTATKTKKPKKVDPPGKKYNSVSPPTNNSSVGSDSDKGKDVEEEADEVDSGASDDGAGVGFRTLDLRTFEKVGEDIKFEKQSLGDKSKRVLRYVSGAGHAFGLAVRETTEKVSGFMGTNKWVVIASVVAFGGIVFLVCSWMSYKKYKRQNKQVRLTSPVTTSQVLEKASLAVQAPVELARKVFRTESWKAESSGLFELTYADSGKPFMPKDVQSWAAPLGHSGWTSQPFRGRQGILQELTKRDLVDKPVTIRYMDRKKQMHEVNVKVVPKKQQPVSAFVAQQAQLGVEMSPIAQRHAFLAEKAMARAVKHTERLRDLNGGQADILVDQLAEQLTPQLSPCVGVDDTLDEGEDEIEVEHDGELLDSRMNTQKVLDDEPSEFVPQVLFSGARAKQLIRLSERSTSDGPISGCAAKMGNNVLVMPQHYNTMRGDNGQVLAWSDNARLAIVNFEEMFSEEKVKLGEVVHVPNPVQVGTYYDLVVTRLPQKLRGYAAVPFSGTFNVRPSQDVKYRGVLVYINPTDQTTGTQYVQFFYAPTDGMLWYQAENEEGMCGGLLYHQDSGSLVGMHVGAWEHHTKMCAAVPLFGSVRDQIQDLDSKWGSPLISSPGVLKAQGFHQPSLSGSQRG